MRNFKVEGIVIKRKNFGEADRILTVLTEKGEKIQVKAAGVRKLISRRSPHVELLNYSLLTLYKGKGFPILIEAQTLGSFPSIKSNLIKIGFAYHICELIDGLCPDNQENAAVFDLFKSTLDYLTKEQDVVSIIHEFEVELLTILGFWSRNHIAKDLDTQYLIENILERKLKSKKLLIKLS